MGEQLSLKAVYYPSEDIVAREIEGDIIIVPLIAGIGDADDELYTLNETGQAIWEKLDGESTLEMIIESLSEKYLSSEENDIKKDVLGFVTEMLRRGILNCVSS